MSLKNLPKIELHLHLDCSLSYNVVRQLNQDISRKEYQNRFIAPEKCVDLADFLKRAPSGFQLMQNEKAVRLVIADLVQQLKQENVVLAEIRFAPHLHISETLTPESVVDIVNDEVQKQAQENNIKLGIILATVRHFSDTASTETARLAVDYKGSNIVGFDIAGDEAGFPLENHLQAFELANQNNIPCTAHAGEALGSGSITETLNNLKPNRIGHGVRCIEDDLVMERLRDAQILLEICPTCNIQTDVFQTYMEHPVDRIKRFGIPVSINTDARTITNITLTDEYQKLMDVFKWSLTDLYEVNMNALNGSFINEEVKPSVENILSSEYL